MTGPTVPGPADGLADRVRALPAWCIVTALLLLGVLIRAPRLAESLWYDEIAAWRDYAVHGVHAALTTYYDPANHVLQTALTAASVPCFGGVLGDELAMRLPSLIASLLLIPLLYGALRAAPFAALPSFAVTAALLAAVMPVAVLSGAEARGYPFMMLSAAGCSVLMLRLIDAPRFIWIALYAVLMAVGIWAHVVTVFVAVGHALIVALLMAQQRSVRPFTPAILSIAAAAALTLLVLSPVLGSMLELRGSARIVDASQPSVLGIEGWHALLQMGGAWHPAAALAALPALVAGVVACRTRRDLRLLVLLMLAGIPLAVLVAAMFGTWIYARFLLFGAAGSMVLMAAGVAAAWQQRRLWGAALLLLVLCGWTYDLISRPARQPVREAAQMVRTLRSADERVLAIDLRHQVIDVYGSDLEPAHSLLHGRDLDRELPLVKPSWVIMLYPRRVDEQRRQLLRSAGLQRIHTLRGWIDWGGGDIEIWGPARALD